MFLNHAIAYQLGGHLPAPLLATAEAENSPIILSGVLLTLVIIYIASKVGSEVAKRLDLHYQLC